MALLNHSPSQQSVRQRGAAWRAARPPACQTGWWLWAGGQAGGSEKDRCDCCWHWLKEPQAHGPVQGGRGAGQKGPGLWEVVEEGQAYPGGLHHSPHQGGACQTAGEGPGEALHQEVPCCLVPACHPWTEVEGAATCGLTLVGEEGGSREGPCQGGEEGAPQAGPREAGPAALVAASPLAAAQRLR